MKAAQFNSAQLVTGTYVDKRCNSELPPRFESIKGLQKPHPLNNGDEIRFGMVKTSFIFVNSSESVQQPRGTTKSTFIYDQCTQMLSSDDEAEPENLKEPFRASQSSVSIDFTQGTPKKISLSVSEMDTQMWEDEDIQVFL